MERSDKPDNRDILIVRELAKKCSEIAHSPRMDQIHHRMRDNNDLRAGRPPVAIFEIPWHEMDIDGKLALRCEHPFAREMEQYFRRELFQQEYFPCDQ